LSDEWPSLVRAADVVIMELALIRRPAPAALAGLLPFLSVPRARRATDRFAIGVVLQSGAWDARRSMSPSLFSPPRLPHLAWFSLQADQPLPDMVDLSASDVPTLASRLRALDLVLTVDTMVAHLAGTLGVPVWTLLPADADWRWQRDRADSPWYPTMRLYRQLTPGAWAPVLDQVYADLPCGR
jgi:hypothetical protein